MTQTTPIDDANVHIPAAVRAASERATLVHNAAYGKADTKPTTEVQAEPTTENTQESIPAELDARSFQNDQGQTQTPTPTQDSKPEPKESVTQTGNDSTWEHKYNSMKGRFDRANSQVAILSEQVANLQNMVATLQEQSQAKAPFSGSSASTKFLTPEEENEYGQEFLSVVGKRAKEEVLPEVADLRNKLADLQAKLTGVTGHVVADNRTRMLESLDQNMPQWRELNENKNFIDWLSLPDPYSGVIRHTMLKDAYEQNNAPRVAAFFSGFLTEEAAVAPVASQPDPKPRKAQIPLESLAAPSRAKTAAADAPTEKPQWSRAQIEAFYGDVRMGKFRGRDAEKARIEQSIFDAHREGLIRS